MINIYGLILISRQEPNLARVIVKELAVFDMIHKPDINLTRK
jgi:hypothetical protein